MTALIHHKLSDEAEWTGIARVWAGGVEQYAPRKERSSWWLVLAGAVLVAVAIWGMR